MTTATANLVAFDYFDLAATPSRNSPMGSLMQRILAESPELSFEEAHQLARTQLLKAAAKRNYRVTTPKQDKAAVEQFRKRVNPTRESGKNTHPGEQS
jgi:hypothetical protein